MNKEPVVIGIDGGGTKTAGRLADFQGNTLAELFGGPANIQVAGAEVCANTFREMVIHLCKKAGYAVADVSSIVIGLAGAGRPSDRNVVLKDLEKKLNFPRAKLTIVSDADIALEAAYGVDPGIIVIAGTGSIVYGRSSDGKIKRMGGWGPIVGDPGSGTDIGIKALQKISRVFDGRIKENELFRMIAGSFGITSPGFLIKRIYSDELKPSELTRPVFEAALNDDESALDILDKSAAGLVNMIKDYLSDLPPMQPYPITLKGGMIESDTIYRRILIQKIKKLPYPISVGFVGKQTIDGAISLALRTA
ncbi:MAG: BadF/BadG/BcrA/BcrD ATPase family protein [Balneolales bacterium]